MATFTQGYTFGATEEVTAAKLHTLVTGASITGIVSSEITNGTIVNADIASVDGSKFIGLANIPSGSGDIPEANLPASITQATTFADLTATTADINGGTIDGATLGGASQVTVTDADINGGTVDGVVIGGASAGAITGTVVEAGTSLAITGTGDDGVVATGIKDEDDMASDSATHLATQQSIKKYVDDSSAALGSWAAATEGASTQATTDGFLVCVAAAGQTPSAVSIKTDSVNPPTVIRGYVDGAAGCACVPVKSGEYYLISTGGSPEHVDSYWIPLA